MSTNENKRRKLFINKTFQGRFILNVFLLILLSSLCSALLIYWITGGDLQAELQTAHGSITNALDHLGISIFIGNMVALLVAGIINIFMVLYASHKIAGPLYRFEKLCEQIGDGQLDGITTLRQGDQLQDIGRAFNEMVTKLRHRKEQKSILIAQLNHALESLQQDQAVAANYSEQLEQVRQALTQLQE